MEFLKLSESPFAPWESLPPLLTCNLNRLNDLSRLGEAQRHSYLESKSNKKQEEMQLTITAEVRDRKFTSRHKP